MGKRLLIVGLIVALLSGSAVAVPYDQYRQAYGDARWQIKYNNLIDTLSSDMSNLFNLVNNWAQTETYMVMVTVTPTYVDGDTFTLAGDYSSRFGVGKVVLADLGADGLKTNTVASSSYGAGTTTVNLNTSNLTNNLVRVWVMATRDGLWPFGPGWFLGRDYGTPGQAALTAVLNAIGSQTRRLTLSPGDWALTADTEILSTTQLEVMPGASFSGTNTLTINGPVSAGDYQIFNFSGAGKVDLTGSPSVANACWWGAKGDGATGGQDVPINKALTASKRVYLPPAIGAYIIDDTIKVKNGGEFCGKLYQTVIKPKAAFDVSKRFVQNYTTAPANDAARDANLYIHDLSFDGNSLNQGSTQFQACIELIAVKDSIVENITGYDNKGDVVHIGYRTDADVHSYNIRVSNIIGILNQRNVVSITGAEIALVENIVGVDCGLSVVDVEPDNNPYAICKDIIIDGVLGRDIGKTFQLVEDYCYGVSVSNSPPGPMIEQVVVNNVNIRTIYGDYSAGVSYRGIKGLLMAHLNLDAPGNVGIQHGDGEAEGGYSTDVQMQGVNITGLAAGSAAGVTTKATLSHYSLHQVNIEGASTYGITPNGSHAAFTDLNIRGAGTAWYGQVDDFVVNGGHWYGAAIPAGTGLYLSNNDRFSFRGLLVENFATGLCTEGGSTITQGLITDNNFQGNTAVIAKYATETAVTYLHNKGLVPGNALAPAVPASTTEIQNTTGYPVMVTVSGGTVTQIATGSVSGSLTATGFIAGQIQLPAGWYIKLTYSAAPSWTWEGIQ